LDPSNAFRFRRGGLIVLPATVGGKRLIRIQPANGIKRNTVRLTSVLSLK
jgi:hypothetical protein